MGVHDDAAHVERAVSSILGQSFRDLELVIVDDGSQDGSSEILRRLAESDARIRLVRQQNAGLTRALIRGCDMARGEFIARQDSDDWSHPERIQEQVALLETDPGIGFASCATQYVGPEDEPLVVIERPSDPKLATEALLDARQGPPAHGSVVLRADAYRSVGGYRAEFLYSQDSDLWLRLAEVANIGYVPSVRYFHRKEMESTSGARRKAQSRFAELSHACRSARKLGRDEGPFLRQAAAMTEELRARRGALGSQAGDELAIAYLLGSQLALNRDSRARRYLWRVLRSRPWHWKAWIRLVQSFAGEVGA